MSQLLPHSSGTSSQDTGDSSLSLNNFPVEPAMALNISTRISQLQLALQSLAKTCENCRRESSDQNYYCDNCNDILCDTCTEIHIESRYTKHHRIISINSLLIKPFTNIIGNDQNIRNNQESIEYLLSLLIPTMKIPQNLGNTAIFDNCDIHNLTHTYYCDTCHVFACNQCININHSQHKFYLLENIIKNSTKRILGFQNECDYANIAVQQAIEKVRTTSSIVDDNAYKACLEAKEFLNRIYLMMEQRLDQQMKKLDVIRETKQNNLKMQERNLRLLENNIKFARDNVNGVLKSSDFLDFILVSKRVTLETEKIRYSERDLEPCENSCFLFVQPNEETINVIVSHIGNLSATINTPPIILPNHRESSIFLSPSSSTDSSSPPLISSPIMNVGLISMPCARPIYRVKKSVSVCRYGHRPNIYFSREGNQNGELCRPWGICCDEFGRIIVADRSNNRIQIFNRNGNFLTMFGRGGKEHGEFDRPAGITVNPVGHIIVCDKDNHRVQIFRSNCEFLMAFGRKGSDNGEFNYPWDVACNSQSQMVISDTRNHRVQLFTSDGQFLSKFGFESTTPALLKHFDSPRGVCFTPNGYVIVTDFNNHRLVIINKNFQNARFLGEEGTQNGQFLRPQGVICDDYGRIIVSDSRNNRLQVFDSNGAFLWKIGQAGQAPGEFDRPCGVALNPDGHIVVIDFGNTRVQVF